MSKILFFSQPTMGHTNAMLTIAVRLKELGHEVLFCIPTIERVSKQRIEKMPNIVKISLAIPEKVKANGIEYISIEIPRKIIIKAVILPLMRGFVETEYAKDVFSDCLYEYATRIEGIILKENPNAIVNDFSFIAPYIISEKYDIPCIPIYHSGLPFRGGGIPPFGTGLPINGKWGYKVKLYSNLSKITEILLKRRFKKACRKIGISGQNDMNLSKPYSRWLNLLLTSAQIEAPREINDNNTIFVGPCFSSKRIDSKDKFPFELLRSDVQKIYVSLGTVFNNKPKVFKKILEGIEKENLQIIVSAGGAYDELIQCGFEGNVLIFRSVPQLEILEIVDLVISHGGNNTINETLTAGKPIVVMPVGGEQADNASKIEYLNVGMKINISNFSSKEVVEKVKIILNDPSFKENAERIKEILSNTDGINTSAELISWVAVNRKPISLQTSN